MSDRSVDNNEKTKVFGIGFHKTGTSSLEAALSHLGYKVCGPVGINRPDIGEVVRNLAFSHTEQYDAFQDNPWPLLYRKLDARYPGSKFILTLRPTNSWIQSVVRHFGGKTTPMREWIYGAGDPEGNEELYIQRYESHNREVREYFKHRPNDLLELRITEGEGWEKLCSFLDRDFPSRPFPHHKKASTRPLRRIYRKSPDWLQKVEEYMWERYKYIRKR